MQNIVQKWALVNISEVEKIESYVKNPDIYIYIIIISIEKSQAIKLAKNKATAPHFLTTYLKIA